MASKVIPINNLTQFGVVKDTPTVGLAPNVFTDAKNIRFRDMAAWKMKGDVALYANLNPTFSVNNGSRTKGEIKFITYWANPNLAPNGGYYVYVIESKNGASVVGHRVIVKNAATGAEKDITPVALNDGFTVANASWQSTNFASGFCLILNNGVDTPRYVIDTDGNTNINNIPILTELPGWDSYNAAPKILEVTLKLTYGSNQAVSNPRLFDLGQKIDFTNNTLFVTKQTPGSSVTEAVAQVAPEGAASTGTISNGAISVGYVPRDITFSNNVPNPTNKISAGTGNFDYVLYNNTETNTTFINLALGPNSANNFKEDDVIRAFVVSRNPVTTTCGILRSFGSFIVAGNLKEVDKTNGNLIRKMTGVVRTSDVAVPGSLPQNWNPFAAGTNTADEFTLAATSTVQDMVPLSGGMYIYTNTSIHKLSLTQSAISPVSFMPVTYKYGAQTTDSVIEFSGRHLVVGSNDIYLFSGNPGNITSTADAKVRDYFYNNLNPAYADNLFLLDNKANDEIWINFPTLTSTGKCNQALIYNYKLNNWTIRDLNGIISGIVAPIVGDNTSGSDRPWGNTILNPNKQFPVLAQVPTSNTTNSAASILAADIGYTMRSLANTNVGYTSLLERNTLSITPEFYTEQFSSIALLTQNESQAATLNVKTISSNSPGATINFASPTVTGTFNTSTSYKSDARLNGRFVSYRIDDSNEATGVYTTTSWNLSGIQIEVQDGGTR